MITATIVATVWFAAAVAICWSNHKARLAAPTPPPDGDPDATAEEYDTDRVERMPHLPPVPQAVWDDLDEVAYRWFAEGLAR